MPKKYYSVTPQDRLRKEKQKLIQKILDEFQLGKIRPSGEIRKGLFSLHDDIDSDDKNSKNKGKSKLPEESIYLFWLTYGADPDGPSWWDHALVGVNFHTYQERWTFSYWNGDATGETIQVIEEVMKSLNLPKESTVEISEVVALEYARRIVKYFARLTIVYS